MTTESVLSDFVDAVKGDAGMLGVLLHGSRANGQLRDDSDYDPICIVAEGTYEARRKNEDSFTRRSSRGIAHEWGDDLEPLKALRFGSGGSVE